MIRTEREELQLKIERKRKLDKILNSDEFQDIFLNYFLKESMYEMMYREGSSPGVVKQLDARKIFNDFVYDIIDDGKNAEEVIKGK